MVNEVMNAGRAVIVSDDVGCHPDLITNGVEGFVYPAGDVGALTEALRKVLETPGLAERMGRAGLERISRWSFEEDVARAAAGDGGADEEDCGGAGVSDKMRLCGFLLDRVKRWDLSASCSMEYRQLGKSGLKVPELCFGAGTFGTAGEFFKAWGRRRRMRRSGSWRSAWMRG